MLDEDEDGKISRFELSKCLAGSVFDSLGVHELEVSVESWERFIQNCDQDGDGKIDFNEFKKHITEQIASTTTHSTDGNE